MERHRGSLSGVRVLDLSVIVAGGKVTSLMADFGAEVVKVELRGGGDPLRKWGPFVDGASLWWMTHSPTRSPSP